MKNAILIQVKGHPAGLMYLCRIDLFSCYSSPCLGLIGLFGNWQNRLSKCARLKSIRAEKSKSTQPSGTSCMGIILGPMTSMMVKHVIHIVYGLLIGGGDKQGKEYVGVCQNQDGDQEEPRCHHKNLSLETGAIKPCAFHPVCRQCSQNKPYTFNLRRKSSKFHKTRYKNGYKTKIIEY